jgi:chromosome segregation ATPase
MVQGDWKLVGDARPVRGSQNLYLFPLVIEPGKAATLDVSEERTETAAQKIAALWDETIQMYRDHSAVSANVKDALKKLSDQKSGLAETQRQLDEIMKQLKEISDDQARLRQNLDKVPSSSEAYKRYVKKFDDQETQIEKLQEQLKQKQSAAKAQQKALEDSAKRLTVE